ncbi:uncharacterized lipoprotein YehR (DUF1307 family) [Fontibacillus solani]|uniref:Lipoprotein n=2 Tax=Fontibacillus TaxID=995014 RepID=A0A1G7RYZ2_9BACL|nr:MULTISPECIES: hypothetical protein [Fontibacillus]MBA9087593.1 uncharacterized lipoprotein YehR (DUF1307 family) [Fontibacillus solani]SDG15976.1 hypothetical protein SAMN04488542_1283 [Fontibacillus panacisegetis]
MRQRGIRYSLCFMLGVLMLSVVVTGCTTAESSSWTSFTGSSVEKSFPVPKEAKRTETALNNSKMDYMHYSLNGLHESEGVPEEYEKAITQWGWEEKTEESTGTTRVYKKDKLTVQLTIHDNSFTVLVPKQQSKAIIQGLESSP